MTPAPWPQHGERWAQSLLEHRQRLGMAPAPLKASGSVVRMVGLVLEAVGFQASIGQRCAIEGPEGRLYDAEVVGFSGNRLLLMAASDIQGLAPGARVTPTGRATEAAVGPALLGRVIDATGRPLDGLGPIRAETQHVPLAGRPINPMERAPIRTPLDVGVRCINALFSVGQGQRMGLFAGSGVGKSVLLGMMARYTSADVIVVGLIGERGREVKEFIDQILGPEGRARAVVVAAPADAPALLRLRGAALATAIAEYFRDQGRQVLLLMDSLTRYAMAQREIALAVGEPPATKGYPPSVFARLPTLVERTGNGSVGQGGITAFYTVLTEGDDQQDPIADSARAILDGHIVLSRSLAEQGHYPAIDIEASISRVMPDIVPKEQLQALHQFKQLYSRYQRNQDLINVGAYAAGADPLLDKAISLQGAMRDFLQQDMYTPVSFEASRQALLQLINAT